MTYQITIQPNGATYRARADETLLEAALRQNILLPHGCKQGVCAACKGTIREGKVDPGVVPPHVLSEAERADGKILFCRAKALSDLVLESKQVFRSDAQIVKTLPARIEEITRAAEDVLILRLMIPANETFTFRAGQYIDLLLPENRRRSYSIANAPEKTGFLELHIRRVAGGFFTTRLFETITLKEILRFEGPHGGFFLRDMGKANSPALLIASGTGFAPIKAMVESALEQGDPRPLHIYWGCRRKEDIYLSALAEAWAEKYAHLRYTPVLSEPDADWSGRTGYVHLAAAADYPDLSAHEVYACGNPQMIEAAQQTFTAQCKLREEAFYSDAFTFAPQGR
ncbi:MAG: CDP-6-deoxy-delta-3,4-glucoseen reductase [Zoogloeaceae bacterium]|jgi:CDP-4-dehydro-6-deoxyglucose reductase|nr:CDP-6-deoxy-delta-3,4-glucoseen reductase [Zoogloeaceae bacterium]